MVALLTNVSTFFTQALSWFGTLVSTITANPLLLIGVSMSLVAFVWALIRRTVSL